MIAIYARQSVERRDSISIEAQIAACRQCVPPEETPLVFTDCGYSGKNTDRPAFQSMMEKVRCGEIHIIIVYKLDRISRSLLDFVLMMDQFSAYGVQFTSRSEQFDTGTELGVLLLKLLMLFAELERKTIQQRVRDNYYARGEQQLYLGGAPPYGYCRTATLHAGKHTAMLTVCPEEATVVRELYAAYADSQVSIGALVRRLNADAVSTRRGAAWSNSGVARILRNPVYVCADARVYAYLCEQGAEIHSSPQCFDGTHGCIVYGNDSARRSTKFVGYHGEHVTIGLHVGFISASQWIACQEKADWRRGSSNRATGSVSWLQGLVRCGVCGGACYAVRGGKENKYGYWICANRRRGLCSGFGTLRTDQLERLTEPVLQARLRELLVSAQVMPTMRTPAYCAAEGALAQTEEKLHHLRKALLDGALLSHKYLRDTLEQLEQERSQCMAELQRHAHTVAVPDAAALWNLPGKKRQLTQIVIAHIQIQQKRVTLYLK